MLQSKTKIINIILENIGKMPLISKKSKIDIWDFCEVHFLPILKPGFLFYKNENMDFIIYPNEIITFINGKKDTIRLSKNEKSLIINSLKAR